jgi:outer membrane protein TolC
MWPALFLAAMVSTASAQTDWVSRFLQRYTPSTATSPDNAGLGFPAPSRTIPQNGAVPLTTADVIRLLLENNRDLTVSRAVPISSLFAISSLYRPFQPTFHVIGNFNRSTTPSTNILQGAVSLVTFLNSYIVGFDQALETGTSYSVDYQLSRTSSNSIFLVFNPAYNATVTYTVNQHLLRNFGHAVNSSQIRIARNNEKVSELDFELQIIDQVTQALNSYWDLVFAAEDVKVKQHSLDLAMKTLHDNEIQVEIGTLAPIDLVQAEAEAATREDDLVTAQGSNDRMQDDLKKMISSNTDPGLMLNRLNLIEPIRQPGAEPILPLAQAIESALENRREMRQAGLDIDNQDINVQYTKNQTRPLLDITGSYAHTGLGGTETLRNSIAQGAQIIEVIPGGISDMFNQLYSFKFPTYTAGFTLQVPLNNRAARGDYDRAINERDLAVKRKAATAQRIALEVRNAYTDLDTDRARVETARRARDLASRRLDAEQQKFELGTSTVRFVLEEQRNLAQAETNEVQALVNYAKALVAYDHAIGNTLSRNNIDFDKQLPVQVTSK